MKEKRIILSLAMVSLLLSPFAKADDNSINIEQSGDNLLLGIEQQGHSNEIKMLDSNSYITASSLSLYLVQINGNPNANPNTIIFDEVSGTGNQIKLCQGCAWNTLDSDTDLTWYYDSFEGGGHEIDITMYGDYNQLAVQQTNQSNSTDGHDFDLHLAGDSNEVKIKQQSDGEKTIDLTIYNDYNDVFIRQKGNGATHTASITLDGSYGTDLILKQLGTTTQSYSLTQNCITVSGCTISVQQGE